MSPKKIAIFAAVGIVILGLVLVMLASKGQKAATGPKWPKELTVWMVGDDTVGFDPLIADFKKQKPMYKDTNVVFTKFANYQDYERSLVNVIADGNSPDVFVVPSTGAGLLESKIDPIPDSFFDGQDLSKNLNRLFDPLLEITPSKNDKWMEIQLMKLRGAPLGYETMGAFYNRVVLDSSVPATWEEFETSFLDNSANAPVALGLGSKYVAQSSAVATLFLVQNEVDSVVRIGESSAVKWLDSYLKYAKPSDSGESVGLASLKGEMDRKKFSATDLFAEGKISIVFGFPSLLREIEYSMKRTGEDATLNKKDLRSAPVPQYQAGKKINLARYQYFSVSKFSQNSNAAADFVGYLTTKSAGDLYSLSFPQYLPARNDVLETLKADKRTMNKDFPWVQIDSFIPNQDIALINFDNGLTSEFEQAFGQAMGAEDPNAQTILDSVQKRVACRKKQLMDRSGFEVSCEN